MKRAVIAVLALLVVGVLTSTPALSQGCIPMNSPQYNVGHSLSAGPDNTHAYLTVTVVYYGTPIMDASSCPHGAGAWHTPNAVMTLSNLTSGVTNAMVISTGSTVQSGQFATAMAQDTILVSPGDQVKASVGGYIFCSVAGHVWDLLKYVRWEVAITLLKDTGEAPIDTSNTDGPGYQAFHVNPSCNYPPDWFPTYIHTPIGRHAFWIAYTSCIRAPDFLGVPWTCTADFAANIPGSSTWPTWMQMLRGYSLPYTGPYPIDCTSYDNGAGRVVTWAPF